MLQVLLLFPVAVFFLDILCETSRNVFQSCGFHFLGSHNIQQYIFIALYSSSLRSITNNEFLFNIAYDFIDSTEMTLKVSFYFLILNIIDYLTLYSDICSLLKKIFVVTVALLISSGIIDYI